MRLRTALQVLRTGQSGALLRALRLATPYYRLVWLVSASRTGLLAQLAAGAVSFDELAGEWTRGPDDHDWLRTWLELGVRVGELRLDDGRYALRGFLARRLARPEHDAIAAILEEVATLHHTLVMETPERVREGRRFTLADQDGVLIARSSPIVRPFVHEAIDAVVPRRGACRLLEVGPGSGTYLRYAAERNRDLTALGVEVQPEVAKLANENLRHWGIASRVRVDEGDVRDVMPGGGFDVMTFHNNIYYFPVDERVALLRHARSFLEPGGAILLTTACSGGGPMAVCLDVWSAATERCGRLPAPEELVAQLHEAGFVGARSRNLVPGDRFHAFVARRPA